MKPNCEGVSTYFYTKLTRFVLFFLASPFFGASKPQRGDRCKHNFANWVLRQQKVTKKSQYGSNGTIENAKWVAGKFGNALEFNGTTSRLEIPSSDSLNSDKELSVAMWFKATDQLKDASGARLMDKWGDQISMRQRTQVLS